MSKISSLKDRRMRLGLSKEALARILDVNPRTIARHERTNDVPILLDYAMRAVEAEARETDKAEIRNDLDPLAPERHQRAGRRMIAHIMGQRRAKRTPRDIEMARLETRERAEAKEREKAQRIIAKIKDDEAMRARVSAKAAADAALEKATNSVKNAKG
jgi:hypothetical protein